MMKRKEDILLTQILENNRVLSDAALQEARQRDYDWHYLCERSKEEGVAQLLYYAVNAFSDKTGIPDKILEELKNIYYNSSLANIQLEKELALVIKNLSAQGIPSIILKGIFLAAAVYKNIGLRPCADIDLLIKKEDLASVHVILDSLGYETPSCYEDLLLNDTLVTVNSLVCNKKDGGFYVHLHWHLINSTWPLEGLVSAIDMDRIWSQAQDFDLDGVRLKTLSPAHLLIYLLYHAFQHSYDHLILVADILRTIETYGQRLRQDEVVREAERFGLTSVCYHSLQCVRGKLGRKDSLVDPWIDLFSKKIYHRKKNCSLSRGKTASYMLSYRVLCLDGRGLAGRIRSLERTFFPSRYVIAHALNLPVAKVRFSHYIHRIRDNIRLAR
jgi:hypothetical protein